jgi:hypothetical protein
MRVSASRRKRVVECMREVLARGWLLLRFYPTDWCKYQQQLFSDDGCGSS